MTLKKNTTTPYKRKFSIVRKYSTQEAKKTDLWENYKSDLCEMFSEHFYTKIAVDEDKALAISGIEYVDKEFDTLKQQRDMLLEELAKIADLGDENDGNIYEAMEIAEQAIQNAKEVEDAKS